jgi:hypothetical protein
MSSGPSYSWMGFNNWVNYAFLGAAGAFTAWQFPHLGWSPLIAAGALEFAWLSVGSRTGVARRFFDFTHGRAHSQLEASRVKQQLRGLKENDRQRYQELQALAKDIERQIEASPGMAMDLVTEELVKVERLLDAYLRLASMAARHEHYVETSDLNQIEAEVRRQESVLEKTPDEGRDLAKKNLVVLERRLEKAIEVRKQVRHSRAQLNLIANTFRLIRDQIVTMESPGELQQQLDELTVAVDSIETADRETDALVKKLDREIHTLRS